MVVKITKLGKLPVKEVYELKCSTCGTEFTCDMIDLRPSPDDTDNLWVYCPLEGCRRPVAWREDRHDDR
jgi:hypothetical protein